MTSLDSSIVDRSSLLPVAGSTLPLGPAVPDDPESWADDLRRVRAAGFSTVDLVDSWVRVDRLGPAALASLREALAGSQLRPVGISVIRASMIDPQDGAANLQRTLRAIDAAATLGAHTVSVGFHRPLRGAQLEGPFWLVPHPEDDAGDSAFALAAKRLGVACGFAADHGIRIALELHESTLLDRSDRVLRLLEQTEAANLGVNLDVGNLIRVPRAPVEPWEQTIDALAPHVNYWHVKNYVRIGHPVNGAVLTDICPVGIGVIDYRTALRTVIAAGFAGPLVVEHYGGDALSAMATGRRYLEGLLIEEGLL